WVVVMIEQMRPRRESESKFAEYLKIGIRDAVSRNMPHRWQSREILRGRLEQNQVTARNAAQFRDCGWQGLASLFECRRGHDHVKSVVRIIQANHAGLRKGDPFDSRKLGVKLRPRYPRRGGIYSGNPALGTQGREIACQKSAAAPDIQHAG